ncbi:MAG: DUF2849 domain-containing protein [Pseudomonadota bacterium]
MPKLKPKSTAILTANHLLSGAIVYWTGSEWTEDPADALRAGDPEAHASLGASGEAEEAADVVVGAYLVAVDPISGDPLELRERQRIAGPSIALPVNVSL